MAADEKRLEQIAGCLDGLMAGCGAEPSDVDAVFLSYNFV